MVQRQKVISYILIYKMSNVEDKIPGFKEKFGQDRNLIIKITKKKVTSKITSK